MSAIKRAKGFVAADTVLPKHVMMLGGAPDGAYLVLANCLGKNSYGERRGGELKKGEVLFSTEGGHYYTLSDASGFKGKGKSQGSLFNHALVQRVSISVTIDTYKAPPKSKKVTKKKATKKKATRRVRPAARRGRRP